MTRQNDTFTNCIKFLLTAIDNISSKNSRRLRKYLHKTKLSRPSLSIKHIKPSTLSRTYLQVPNKARPII